MSILSIKKCKDKFNNTLIVNVDGKKYGMFRDGNWYSTQRRRIAGCGEDYVLLSVSDRKEALEALQRKIAAGILQPNVGLDKEDIQEASILSYSKWEHTV